KRRFHAQGLLDLIGAHVRVLTVFHETRALVLAHELHDGRGVGLPVLGETFEIFEYRVDARGVEDGYRILAVLVEVRVEDALVHEVRVTLDREEQPAQVVELQGREGVWLVGYGLLDLARVLVEVVLAARNDLREYREPVVRGSFRVYRAVSALFDFVREETALGDRHRGGL